MKVLLISAAVLFLAVGARAQETPAEQAFRDTIPVSQPLVREGDFAIRLVQALELGTTDDEAQAESLLVAAGIAPGNAWISDYPVTPDMILELRDTILAAVDAGRLGLGREEALTALQAVIEECGLYVQLEQDIEPAQDMTRTDSYAESGLGSYGYGGYTYPAIINGYYNTYGPPVVTYYAPPLAFRYLYAWVPAPFRWYRYYCPGFFILRDFHKAIAYRNIVKLLSNRVIDFRKKGFFVLDHHKRRFFRGGGKPFHHAAGHFRPGGFDSAIARKGAETVLKRTIDRSRFAGAGYGSLTARGRSTGPVGFGNRIDPGVKVVGPGIRASTRGARQSAPLREAAGSGAKRNWFAPRSPAVTTGYSNPAGNLRSVTTRYPFPAADLATFRRSGAARDGSSRMLPGSQGFKAPGNVGPGGWTRYSGSSGSARGISSAPLRGRQPAFAAPGAMTRGAFGRLNAFQGSGGVSFGRR